MDIAEMCENIRKQEKIEGESIEEFVNLVADGEMPIKNIEEWLRAVYNFGLSNEAKITLTKSMMESGEILSWNHTGIDTNLVVDKHSTGGVGDKMSLMLAPALAACGLYVPMLAGRGLGHTGGTIDKLEAIPGFSTDVSPSRIKEIVLEVGCCIASQSEDIAPADGLLYAVRDVTGTVASIPLITASIISKKVAEGISSLVLDVKTGSAAFMQSEEKAIELAKSMTETARGLGVKTVAQVTRMDVPIGTRVGNSLEVIESIHVMNGLGPEDTTDLVALQGGMLLVMTGLASDEKEGQMKIRQTLSDGSALNCFRKMCIAQGVDMEIARQLCTDPENLLPISSNVTHLQSPKAGYVGDLQAMKFAEVACDIGAGRKSFGDEIDHAVGLVFHHVVGDIISKGDVWISVHHEGVLDTLHVDKLLSAIRIDSNMPSKPNRLVCVIE